MRLLALLLVLSGPALATPPQIVTATDDVVGVTDTHLYLLRSLWDNHGSHYVTQTDQMLVEKSIVTGRDTAFWPLRRTLSQPDWDDTEERYVLEEIPLETGYDFVDVLRDKAARPMVEGRAQDAKALNWSLVEGTLTLTIPHGGPEIAIPSADLTEGIMRDMIATRQALPPIFLEGGFDALTDYSDFALGESCVLDRYHHLWHPGLPDTVAVRISCDDIDLGPPMALYVIVSAP